MMTAKFGLKSKIAAAGVAAAMVAAPATALASQGSQVQPNATTASTVNWQVPLKGSTAYPTATGSAQYQSQPGQRELQIEVYRIRSLAGKTVTFSVNGALFGKAKVSATGVVRIDHNTERGQSVPSITHGSKVAARTAAGTLIASGAF